MTLIDTWRDVRPGTILTVKRYSFGRPYKFLVESVKHLEGLPEDTRYAAVTGRRLRMNGTLSTRQSFRSTFDVLHLEDVKGQEWDLGALQVEAVQVHGNRRRHNADGKRARGTSNGNSRGGSEDRRKRKLWLLGEFGDGSQAACSFGCGATVTMANITVDRFPVPGCQGGTYARGNIRPACPSCNSSRGAVLRRH